MTPHAERLLAEAKKKIMEAASAICDVLEAMAEENHDNHKNAIAFSDKPPFINWTELPQVIYTKKLADIIGLSENLTRCFMHSEGFPLDVIHDGGTRLTVNKDKLREYLSWISHNEEEALLKIRDYYTSKGKKIPWLL